MRIGTGLPNVGVARTSASAISAYAQEAEQRGFDSLWGGDRLYSPHQVSTPYPGGAEAWEAFAEQAAVNMDPFIVPAAAMVGTERIRFSWSTLNAPTHQPIHLARALTTLDVLCEGRLDAGFGLSWMKDEYDSVAHPWDRRGAFFDDILSFLDVWWTADPVSYDSAFISVPPCYPPLRPVQVGGPPVYLGGLSVPAMRRIGRRAQGWLALDGLPPEFDTLLWSTAARAAEDAGRDPAAIERIVRINAAPGEDVESMTRRVAAAEAAGAAEVIIEFLFASSDMSQRLDLAGQVLRRHRT